MILNYRKNKGITLIALVITIIVLLILAGVSIAMLTGQNGILTQAQKAKTETENAAKNEAGILSDYETKINEELGIKPEAEPGHYYETNTEVTVGDETVTIPGGASLSKIEGEYEDVEQGIVIYITNKQITDEEWQDVETMQKTYDQFVWVPVTGDYKRNTDYENTNVSAAAYTDTGYLPEGIQPAIPADSELEIPEGKTKEEVIGEINEQAEREAVTSKGGFYISRYEAGKETTTNKLISRKGATVWNSIPQAECKTESKKYTEEYNTSLNENVKSALCSGIQWDMTMAFVNGKQDGSSDADKTYNVTQPKPSRHIGSSPAASGKNPADRVCNIFDLEGNYYEYVAEKNSYYDNITFVFRGGNSYNSYSASYRSNDNGRAYSSHSFRFTLYVM